MAGNMGADTSCPCRILAVFKNYIKFSRFCLKLEDKRSIIMY